MTANSDLPTGAVAGSSPLDTEPDPVLGDVETFLQTALSQLEPDFAERRRTGPGRPRVLPTLCLWASLLVCVLRGMSSQLALWRLISQRGFWSYPRFAVTDQAIYKRLAQAGTAPLEQLFAQISALLAARLAPYALGDLAPFATEVVALDEMTLDQVARFLPTLRNVPAGDRQLLPGKLAGSFDLRRQQWRHVQHVTDSLQNDKVAAGDRQLLPGKLAGSFDLRRQQWRHVQHVTDSLQNDKVAARDLVADLPAASLILADLGYFAFAWFDELTAAGQYWISRLRQKTSYQVLHVYYQQGDVFDAVIHLGAYRADRASHAVRLVRFQVGTTRFAYITNVLDPHRLPLADIARLYARRWDIELAFKMLKRHLHLHLLWSSKSVVILQQLWAVLIIAQILHALQLEIAQRAGVGLFDVSLALLVEYGPRYAAEGQDPIEVFVRQGRDLHFIRPSTRTQIRAPVIPPESLQPLPADLVLTRTPRHPQRKCGRGEERR